MKIMQIEALWNSLEADAAAGRADASGWLLRLARPSAHCPIFVGVELATRRRAILLNLGNCPVPPRRAWPRSKGLESVALAIENGPHFGVALKETKFADVFTALAEDISRRVMQAATPADRLRTFLAQLARWQKFLSVSSDGLGEQAQRGLWGELYFLRDQIIALLGAGAATAWTGGEHAHQDFQLQGGSVEIKTTLAKLPQAVRITSERQLDDSTLPALFLGVIALDIRQGGTTLPAMIASIRSLLLEDVAAEEHFEDQLLQAGYLDAHASRYTERAYAVRDVSFFAVRRNFPRLVESDMPNGVGDANYALSVAACEPFRVQSQKMLLALTAAPRKKSKKRKRHA